MFWKVELAYFIGVIAGILVTVAMFRRYSLLSVKRKELEKKGG